jgi:hypothetical protein
MTGTSLFWGIGATLRFLLVAWVPAGAPITGIAVGFGAALSLAIGMLWLRRRWLIRVALSAS